MASVQGAPPASIEELRYVDQTVQLKELPVNIVQIFFVLTDEGTEDGCLVQDDGGIILRVTRKARCLSSGRAFNVQLTGLIADMRPLIKWNLGDFVFATGRPLPRVNDADTWRIFLLSYQQFPDAASAGRFNSYWAAYMDHYKKTKALPSVVIDKSWTPKRRRVELGSSVGEGLKKQLFTPSPFKHLQMNDAFAP